jgi:hypothetical protein
MPPWSRRLTGLIGVVMAAAGPVLAQESRIPDSVKARETVANDSDTAARIGNEPLDPALTGFFLIPGTSTRLKVGGYIRLDVIHDLEPVGNHDEFLVSSIPVDVVSTADNTSVHARQTRFNLDLRRPAGDHDLRVLFEFDFFGSAGERALNLRHAYGQVANVLAGFTTSTLQDADARPDTLDHEGPAARVAVRQAQVRYTQALPRRQSLAMAIEAPRSDVLGQTAAGPVTTLAPWPDVIARYRWDAKRGHLQAGVVFRSIGGFAGTGEREAQVFGSGTSISGSLLVGARDTVVFEASGGRGFARYIKDAAGLGLDLAVDASGTLHAAGIGAGVVGFQHVWSKTWRTTIAGSFDRLESFAGQSPDTYRSSATATANLIAKPRPLLSIGVEYNYGRFEVQDGRHNAASRVQFAVQFDLVK